MSGTVHFESSTWAGRAGSVVAAVVTFAGCGPGEELGVWAEDFTIAGSAVTRSPEGCSTASAIVWTERSASPAEIGGPVGSAFGLAVEDEACQRLSDLAEEIEPWLSGVGTSVLAAAFSELYDQMEALLDADPDAVSCLATDGGGLQHRFAFVADTDSIRPWIDGTPFPDTGDDDTSADDDTGADDDTEAADDDTGTGDPDPEPQEGEEGRLILGGLENYWSCQLEDAALWVVTPESQNRVLGSWR